MVDHLAYDSFGNLAGESNAAAGDRFKYTGRETSTATGLQYNRARYYDPAVGRWIARDPIGFAAGDPNLYRYVGNGPTDATDPSGLAGFDWRGRLDSALAFTHELVVVQGGNALSAAGGALKDTVEGGYALATSSEARDAFGQAWYDSRVQPLADRLLEKAELRGDTNPGYVALGTLLAEDLAGAKAIEAYYGADLTGKPIEGGLLDGGARTQLLLFGIADLAGALAAGLSEVSAITGLTFDLEKGLASLAPKINPDGCFAAGTPILVPGGSKYVEDIRPGDHVLSAPEDDPEAIPCPRLVEAVFQNYLPLMELRLGRVAIRATIEHPFWVEGRGWTPANMLVEGDRLRGVDGRPAVLTAVARDLGAAPVYNMRVAQYHTYFVGSPAWGVSVWSHNADCGVNAPNNEVYRALRADEDPTEGLRARSPGANTEVGSHVMGKKQSDLISTTRDQSKAEGLFNSGNGVVGIDLDKVLAEVVDASQGVGRGRVFSRTRSHQEVLIRDPGGPSPPIPPEAIRIIR